MTIEGKRRSGGGASGSAWSAAAQGAFIGAVHRIAARLDDQFELVAGALSSDRRTGALRRARSSASRRTAPTATIAADGDRGGARATDGIEAVAIVTPNHLHYPVATAFLEAGIHVICDKPLTTTLARSARNWCALVAATRRVFAVTHNYTGLSDGAAGARDGRARRARRDPRRAGRISRRTG